MPLIDHIIWNQLRPAVNELEQAQKAYIQYSTQKEALYLLRASTELRQAIETLFKPEDTNTE